MGAPSKSWENARAQNPVPTITNQPTEPVTVEEEIDNISNQMQNAWNNIDVEVEFDEPNEVDEVSTSEAESRTNV